MGTRVLRYMSNRSGSVAIEFALIAPILLLLFIGVFEVEEAIRADMKVSAAAQTMAMLVAMQSSVSSTQMTDYCTAAGYVMAPFSSGPLQIAVASVTNNAGVVGQDWSDTTCGNASAIADATASGSSMVPTATNSVIVVQATYRYTGAVNLVLPSTITMTQTQFSRPRNTPATGNATIPHY